MDIVQILSAAMESALNRYLSLDPEGLSRFSALEGNIINISISGTSQVISLFPSADGFLLLNDFDGDADATIHGSIIALTKMGLAKDPKDLLFSGEIKIEGDTRVANQFNRILSKLDIDWEEIAAQSIGDIAAHKLGNLFRDANQWFQRSATSVNLDTGEYIQEEIHLSPSNAELRQFINQVDELREGADRLAAKIQIIKNIRQQSL